MSRDLPHTVEHAVSAMGSVVTVQIVGPGPTLLLDRAREAMRWVHEVERVCSRFDAQSELSRLTAACEVPVPVSPLLGQVLHLAVAVASASDGAFDPTIGSAPPANWRSIHSDLAAGTVMLAHPLRLDLGGIAKGFAVDLVAHALADLPNVVVNAGGDLYCRGHNLRGERWSIGIQDPFRPGALLTRISLDEGAVCTSGSYERRSADGNHHLVDPATGRSAHDLVSCTVVGESTAMADALATAAFILGRDRGPRFLHEQGVDALLVDIAGGWHVVAAGGRVHPADFHPLS